MCDIVTIKCEGCKRSVETHIGSFSVHHDRLTIFCHNCHKQALQYMLLFDKELIVFTVENCFFITDLPRSIGFNGEKSKCLGRIPKRRTGEKLLCQRLLLK
jgi:hypothetical protein